MIYPHVDGFKHTDYPVLSANKEVLLNRRIKRFAQWNWWHWGRPINPRLGEPRVYVNAKIRAKNPFFLSESDYWDASILAVFPLREGINMEKFTMDLNMVDWESMGLRSGTRLMLSQRVLSNVILPENFRRYLP
jgi:adenine-specific DNA-methyltransferase